MTARPPSTNSGKKHGTALLGFLAAVAVIITHQPSRNIPTGRAIYKSITDEGGPIRGGFEHVFNCSPTLPSHSSVYFFCCRRYGSGIALECRAKEQSAYENASRLVQMAGQDGTLSGQRRLFEQETQVSQKKADNQVC